MKITKPKIFQSKIKTIILLVNLVIVLVAAGIAAYIFLGDSKEKPAEMVCSIYDPGDPFVTNVSDSTKFLKADITLEYKAPAEKKKESKEESKDAAPSLGEMTNSEVRDIVILTLRGFSEDQLTDPEAQKTIESKLIEELNKNADKKKLEIINVFFDEFIAT